MRNDWTACMGRIMKRQKHTGWLVGHDFGRMTMSGNKKSISFFLLGSRARGGLWQDGRSIETFARKASYGAFPRGDEHMFAFFFGVRYHLHLLLNEYIQGIIRAYSNAGAVVAENTSKF